MIYPAPGEIEIKLLARCGRLVAMLGEQTVSLWEAEECLAYSDDRLVAESRPIRGRPSLKIYFKQPGFSYALILQLQDEVPETIRVISEPEYASLLAHVDNLLLLYDLAAAAQP